MAQCMLFLSCSNLWILCCYFSNCFCLASLSAFWVSLYTASCLASLTFWMVFLSSSVSLLATLSLLTTSLTTASISTPSSWVWRRFFYLFMVPTLEPSLIRSEEDFCTSVEEAGAEICAKVVKFYLLSKRASASPPFLLRKSRRLAFFKPKQSF